MHQRLHEGRLEFIIGAGASRAAGMPGWEELIRGLVGRFLQQEEARLELVPEDTRPMADVLISALGREAAVDHLRTTTGGQFDAMLASALYSGGPFEPKTLHYELAALVRAMKAGRKRLYTFNFDDLLERAIAQFGERVRPFTHGDAPLAPEVTSYVTHLHGYLSPEGAARGRIVLSERDFHQAAAGGFDWTNNQLESLLYNPEKTVLMLGLSLTDPRLRKILLDRSKRMDADAAEVFVFLSQRTPPRGADLPTRLAYTFLKHHEAEFWRGWRKMTVIPIASHDLIPFYLRQVRLGRDGTTWTQQGQAFLESSSEHFPRLYEEELQRKITEYLSRTLKELRERFGVSPREIVHLGGFAPAPEDGFIQMGFQFRGDDSPEARARDRITAEYAARRRLDMRSLERPQGAAGTAFIQGATIEALRNSPQMDIHFTPEMRHQWAEESRFRGILCVPIYDSPGWIPVGVVYMNSNLPEPFWTRLDVGAYSELEGLLRACFRQALRYHTVLGEPSTSRMPA